MKTLMIALLVALTNVSLADNPANKMAIGSNALLTEAEMKDVSGTMFSIDKVKQENGVLVLFSSNTCPFVLKWEGRYNELKKWGEKHKVGFIVLNSNHQNRSGVDSFEAMQKHAAEKKYDFPYVLDADSKIANAFGGQTTPHAFLFDKNGQLAYKGAIDDNYDDASAVKKAYVKEAIASLSSGKKIEVQETKPVGCSIKRKLD